MQYLSLVISLPTDEYQGDQAKFFEELGSGSPDSIPDSSPEDDEEAEKADNQEVTLYQVAYLY